MELKGRKKIVNLHTAIHDIFVYSMEVCLLFYITSILNLHVLKQCDDKREIMDELQSKERQKSNKVKTELSRLISMMLVVLHQGANPANIIATPALTDSPGGVWWRQRRQRRCCGLTDV